MPCALITSRLWAAWPGLPLQWAQEEGLPGPGAPLCLGSGPPCSTMADLIPLRVTWTARCLQGCPAVSGPLRCWGHPAVSRVPCGVGGALRCQGLPAVSGAPCIVGGALQCWGLPAALGALYIVEGSPECQGHPAVLGAPCGVGGLPAVLGALRSMGLPATWGPWADCSGRGPWRAPALLPPHLAPLCSLCSEPGPLPDPACHREGQLRQGKAAAGRAGRVWAGPAAWVCWRVWLCLPQGRPAMLEASRGLSVSPPPLGSPGPGLWALVAQLTLS